MEEIASRAFINFTGTAPSHRFGYVDDTWVKIRTRGVEAFTENINTVDGSHGKISEETVCPSCTVCEYTLKKTEASTMRCRGNIHTRIGTSCSTLITGAQAGGHQNPKPSG